MGLLIESSIISEEDEVGECCPAEFLSFPDRNWTMSSANRVSQTIIICKTKC